ncbi:MAG: hypothetical protein K0R07_1254 [Sedimentibacter sp.]|jgi:hypothetical protein|nr:hypothetical protein [Sedimentibacter sp.]
MKRKILLVLIVLIIILFIPIINQFTISNEKTNNIVFSDSINNFKSFYVSFKHSVNRTPVNEYYRIENNKFVAYKTTFYSYGAGMPDGSENPNADMNINDNGLIELTNINREFNEFTYMVGTYAEHTMHTENKSFKLDKYVEPQEPAIFQIKRVSIYHILRRSFDE